MKKFENKVAIITGSSRGIGKSTAIELLKNGASVILCSRNKKLLEKAKNELKKISKNVIAVCCDVSDPVQAKTLINETIKTFSKLDILINNAGISMRGNINDLNPKVFETIFQTNVFGAVNTTIPALPYIKKSQGSIVFVSSIAGIRGLPGNSAYCSSKMALRAIAESLRIEEIKSKIHVGLVYVGITEIEPGKKTVGADGTLIELMDRSIHKVHSMKNVSKAILRNIDKRKFRTTLTRIGKLNAFLQPIFPDLIEKILINSSNVIKRRGL